MANNTKMDRCKQVERIGGGREWTRLCSMRPAGSALNCIKLLASNARLMVFIGLSVSESCNRNDARCSNATAFPLFKISTKTPACFPILFVYSAYLFLTQTALCI